VERKVVSESFSRFIWCAHGKAFLGSGKGTRSLRLISAAV
jgi:hypothetical protein